jgi:hypothetical protein
MVVYDIRKIQRRTTKSKGKTYYTYYINLPMEWIEEAKVREGDKVELSGDETGIYLKIIHKKQREEDTQ